MTTPLFRLPPPSTLGRGTQLLELGMVIVVIFLPTLHALALALALRPPATPAEEINDWIVDLGRISLVLYLLWRDRGTLSGLGLVGTPWKEVVYGAVILGLAFAASWSALITGVEWFGFGEQRADPVDPTYLLPVSIFLGAAAEEVVFRCYLWVRLVDLTRRPALSLILISLLFSVVHGYDAALSLGVFVSGCVWGLFYWATGRLPRLVVAHWAENMVRVYWL